jgi:hypothetical protein
VSADAGFVGRFGDLRSPAITWLNDHGVLNEAALKDPPKLTPQQTQDLLAALVDAKGFGLEAARGALFRSLSKADEPLLLQVRVVSFYSPNGLSMARAKTIAILVRHLRQDQ